MPIVFLMTSFGMGIGIGGASIVSRSLGAKDRDKAQFAFNNQIVLTLLVTAILIVVSILFFEVVLIKFGASGEIYPFARTYFVIPLVGAPFLSWAMMCNPNLRAEGKAKVAMLVLLIPAGVNILLDFVLVQWLETPFLFRHTLLDGYLYLVLY